MILIISRNVEFMATHRSIVLNLLNFFLCGRLKNTMLRIPAETFEELRAQIIGECTRILPHVLERVFDNIKGLVALCLQEDGSHLRQLF